MVNQASNNQLSGPNKKAVPTAKTTTQVSGAAIKKMAGTNRSFQKMPKSK